MLVLPSQTRISQPQFPSKINWNNTITKGLVFAFNGGSGFVDLVSGNLLTITGTVSRSFSKYVGAYTSASTDVLSCTLSQQIPTTGGVSILEIVDADAFDTLRKRSVRLSGATGTVLAREWFVNEDIATYQDSISIFPTIRFPSYSAKTLYTNYIAHQTGDIYPRFYRNGQVPSTTTNPGTGTRKEPITSIYIGNNTSALPLIGRSYLVFVFNRVLSPAEQVSLQNNPWQIFQPDRGSIFLPATSVTLTYLRPSADISTGSWTPSTGTSLYAVLDEVTPSDADYIQTSTASSCEIRLAAGATPSNRDNHTIRYRILAGSGTLTAVLKCGSTTIKSWNHTLTGSAQDISNALTNAEASTITDYSDLRVTFTGS